MLGFQYVVAKSREFSSALDRELQLSSSRSAPFSSSSQEPTPQPSVPAVSEPQAPSFPQRNEGSEFLRVQQEEHNKAVQNHIQLLNRGHELSNALAKSRATLQNQAASEQFLTQNFHLVARVKQQLAGVRALVLKVAEDAEDVENLLVQRCEESAARQNADFAAQQQQELEMFEASIAMESESRKRELLEMRRQKLASAFYNDLRTYQTLVAHHGGSAAKEASAVSDAAAQESLDLVELVVTADPDQLAAFYESGSEDEEEPKFASPTVLKELEEEEEKSEEADEDVENAKDTEISGAEKGDDAEEAVKGVSVDKKEEDTPADTAAEEKQIE